MNDRPKVTLELSVECYGLEDRDILSKSDPVCIMSFQDIMKTYIEYDRTEHISNTVNPKWTKTFKIDYRL